jgi:hypothetical protein
MSTATTDALTRLQQATSRQKQKTPMTITGLESSISTKRRAPRQKREHLHDWSHAS